MPEAICVIYDNKGTCKQVGIYDGGRICGYHWAHMKTPRWSSWMDLLWIFRHPVNQDVTVTIPHGSVPLDDEGKAEWNDIMRLLNA